MTGPGYPPRVADDKPEGRIEEFSRAVEHPEVERTCSQCGEKWQVPSHYVQADADVGALNRALNPAATEQELSQYDEARRQFETCPGCGAYNTYSQRHLILERRDQDVLEKE